MNHALTRLLALSACAAACNVESTAPPSCGVDAPPRVDGCPAGIAVSLSDYASTQIAFSALDGTTQCESFLSSASAKTDGLAFAFSGDIALPSSPPPSGRFVVIDRFGTNVITWADPKTSAVLAQLAIGTGFESNPADYLELDDTRAIVTRFGENAAPGREAFDRGGDVLVLDTRSLQILDSIPLPREDDLPPRPGGMTRLGDRIFIPLARSALDFRSTGTAMLVTLDAVSLDIKSVLSFPGLKGCGRPAASPDASRIAVACIGEIDTDGNPADGSQSALLLLDPNEDPPRELARFRASELGSEALQNDVVFATDDVVLLKTQTSVGGADNNRWLALDLRSGALRTLSEAGQDSRGKGRGLVYGAMFCAPGCSDFCLLADAEKKALARVQIRGGDIEPVSSLEVESTVGLAPRDIAAR